MTCARIALLLALATTLARDARAVQVDALDPAREWQLGKLEFQGNHAVNASRLRDAMTTRARPWFQVWQVWKPLPPFEPATFRADLDRLRQLYRNAGYYEARIEHDVEVPAEGNAVRVVVRIDEGEPVRVDDVAVALEGEPLPAKDRDLLLRSLPLKRGDVFSQDAYARTYTVLRTYYREHAFARVEVTRRARVDVSRHAVDVAFTVQSGPASVFGDVHVSGTHGVDPEVVRREVVFRRGEPFKQSLVERTRSNLVALRIFSSVRIVEEKGNDPVVNVDIHVAEGPTREVRLGIGYDTEEEIRGIASWRDYNFNGGARQLGFTARASFVRRTLAADFLQPHFPGLRDRIRVLAFEQQEDEETYTNDRSRFSPRIEWQTLPELVPYAFYRIEYDSLSGVNEVVKARFPDIAPSNAVLSGLGFGVDWNGTDDPTDPSRGWGANAQVEPVGGFLGGDFSFVRVVVEARRYQPLPERLLAALRVRIGTEELTGSTPDVPLYERFYAGGLNSVRGYARRRVGPLVADDPIGGKSLLDGSAELRHPVTERTGAAVFFDAGEVSLASHDYPLDALRYGTGFGVYYKSPVGPLRLDLGFPVNPPRSEQRWQIHVAIGQTF